MTETGIQRVSLFGQVIQDLTYEELSPGRFEVELAGVNKAPLYKQGGFFAFNDVKSGEYTLRISGARFQPQEHLVTIPLQPLVFDSPPTLGVVPILESPGDNELVVIVKALNTTFTKITFDPTFLMKEIRAGAQVQGAGVSTLLAAALDIGKVTEARLQTLDGLTVGSIVRIIRGHSIRMRFDPYYLFPSEPTRIVGRVVLADAPEITLEGSQVRLAQVNGADVELTDVAGAMIATVEIDGADVVLGGEKDVVTRTNRSGDYNLYSTQGGSWESVTLEVALPGHPSQTVTALIDSGHRNTVNFQLTTL